MVLSSSQENVRKTFWFSEFSLSNRNCERKKNLRVKIWSSGGTGLRVKKEFNVNEKSSHTNLESKLDKLYLGARSENEKCFLDSENSREHFPTNH